GGRAGAVRNATGSLLDPLQRAASAVVDWMEGIYGYIYQYNRIMEENSALRAENAALREQVRDHDALEAENVRLRALFAWSEQQVHMDLEAAKIVSWDPSNYVSAFTISKGSNYGIELGDCVITEYGALVGQVMELGDDWATVRTIIDVDMDVGALVGVYNYAGMVTGDFALMRAGKTRLAYLTSGAQIFTGDEVTTSGRGGSFPAGLYIGVISAVMTEDGGQATYGVIDPAVDVSRLSQVFIVKDFEIIE
ncbi:MAG: rod shape-determining protein MreC, partial [Oscillospiraceae bacterium]|nr:rod shape-determining protein MreC [Oscillospiraceae bacterium]